MNIPRRVLALISLSAFWFMTQWGWATQSGVGSRGQAVPTLRLTEGSQTVKGINLAGARNEYVFSPVWLAGASPSLKAKCENAPRGLECKVFRVVAVPPASAGEFPPDGLLLLDDGGIDPAPGPQLLWISFKICPDLLPGSYPFTLAISHGGGNIRLPVDLKVFRFTLPEDLPITIFGGLWHQPKVWSRYAKNDSQKEIRIIQNYYQSLREYKFNALGGSYPLPLEQIQPGHKIEDFSEYHELLRCALHDVKFRYFQIPTLKNWKSVDHHDSPFSRQARIFYPLYNAYLKRHGWEQKALNYLVDEPPPEQHGAVVQAFSLAKSLAPGIRTLSAGWRPSPEFTRVIDIWAHQASRYREDERERGNLQGQEAWLYANRLHGIEHPLSHQRLVGWLLYRYQFSGYLLWGVNYWPDDPWTTSPGPKDFYRRGTFYYPHPRTGLPMPTTRLEALRRGFQDYQYFLLLDQARRRGLIAKEQEAQIFTKIQRVTQDLPKNSYPVSMAELESLRLQIGELLNDTEGL